MYVLVDAVMEKLILSSRGHRRFSHTFRGKWRKITAIQIWQSGLSPPGAATSAETVVLSSSTAFF